MDMGGNRLSVRTCVTGEVAFGIGTIAAVIVLLFMIYMIFRKGYTSKESNPLRAVDAVN